MKEGKIAGPFVPLYPEVTIKLREDLKGKTHAAQFVYIALMSLFPVEEVWDNDNPVWVSGAIRVNKKDIAKASGVGERNFLRLWRQLIDAGLVRENEGGAFTIPYFKKKAYDSISALEVRERLSRLEDFVTKNGPGTDGQDSDVDNGEKQNFDPLEGDHDPLEGDHDPLEGDQKGSAILLKDLKEESEEEEKNDFAVGSGGWIGRKLDLLWPGRGFRVESDGEYVSELENFTRPELESAFERAQKDGARYGNYEYILNFLRNPALYNKGKGKPKAGKKKEKVEPVSSPHIGKLKAAWMKSGD